ncbi:serine hydrolase [Paenibacillus sp. XY044]|uniref:serine hydrolase domain-containing protein n=1 Tax=Paenibacillus sp. XY044 TaxID=2026089 RepID=UPI000B991DAE|nr:serine hydrolase domain-containing protein [Paenibacillus sp. XY044]OZB96143.1 hypothetical protein CJP46_09525 [Paenibacillus sp. XY044]
MIKIVSIAQEIDQYMVSFLTWESYFSGYFNGAVLVAQKGEVLLSKGYGFSNMEHNVPNYSKTKFRIGSMTKQFTAVAILHLFEVNNLNIHEGINKYLPDYPNGQSITVHHLLTHTSGISNLNYFHSMRLYITTEKLVERIKELPLLSEPGEQFSYSNAGYILLAYILEKISGMSYEDYLRINLLEPLSMNSTGCDNFRTILKDRASGYSKWEEVNNTEFIDMSTAHGAGNLFSTVEDLFLWDRAISEKKYLFSEEFTKLLFTPFLNNYGYGWFITENNYTNSPQNKLRVHHSGGINGFSAEYSRIIPDDITIILLSNFDSTPVYTITKRLIEIVLESN